MRMASSRVWVVAAVVSLAGMAPAAWSVPALVGGTGNVEPSSAEVLASDSLVWRQHVTTLANPFMEGRAPGTKGNRTAADYVQWNFERLGLKPAFPLETKDDEGNVSGKPFASYRQEFKAPPSQRPEDKFKLIEQAASYEAGGKARPLVGGKDFNALGYSATGEVTGPVVFAGYSLDIEEHEYYSYPPKTDLSGKVVMIFRFEPLTDEGKSQWSEDEDQPWTTAAAIEPKFREATYHNAAAIIFVNPPGVQDDRASRLEDIRFGGTQQKVPVIMMSRDAADAFVRKADKKGRSLMDLRKLADKSGGVVEFKDNVRLTINTKIEKPVLMTDNVGAILPGKGKLADEYVVIGSHYDHVGYGYFGSRAGEAGKIHPGADDNASGTSGNLLVAKKLAEAYAALPEEAEARSVLFLAFSAEESGLVGSKWYTKHMIAPVDKHYLMLNMDMIGRLRNTKQGLEIGGVGTAKGLKSWLQPYIESSGINVKQSKVGAPNSDHFSFYTSKIPSLFFFTGLHKEYHTPADTVDLLNFDGAAQTADLVFRIALDAAQREEPFAFSNGTGDDDEDLKETNTPEKAHPLQNDPAKVSAKAARDAEKAADKDPHAGNPHAAAGNPEEPAPVQRPARRVRLGIAPGNYADDEPGVMVDSITSEDSPAAKAGLREGDRLMKWDDTVLKDVMTLQTCMEKSKPGDTVKIALIRDGKEMSVDVKLTAPAGSSGPVPK
jgi:Zn-dependent M28 family amino/carboxypeptidase